MKALLIKQCPDKMRWYADLVGKTVPFLGSSTYDYASYDKDGLLNFIGIEDAEIIDIENK